MKRILIMVAILTSGLLAGCSNAQSPHREPHTPADGEVTIQKRDVSGQVVRDLLLANLQATRAVADSIVHDAKPGQDVASDRQLRTEGLKEERDKAFNELRHYRGINAASATQAILDAADVSRLAMDYAQAVRDGDPVAKAEKRYDAVAETLTQDVDLLYDALTVPRR
ncbi:hypothetical protein [Secundilactobacillus kimchicus]|uniref:Lipoprotein n=1 Tax=Secundilactobacillus kimchicus JCM 15530 TaxID=1302272 RepID=A0A0R1HKV7_9LACO|nr:hypothetical protein [Secundilactobacillus kimchicus]KRK46888.1 hypothetical protein FC96_GL000881 [Secundilactobacillus kimchicus JCM 15530]MBT9670654.1 hypothetical protein [Secundilactobacillus kimchicus]